MRLSVQFITLAIAFASTVVDAAAVHNLHGIHHNHHAKRDIETKTETHTIVVNQFGEPYATPEAKAKHVTPVTVTQTATETQTSTSFTLVEKTTTPTPTSTSSIIVPRSTTSAVAEPSKLPEANGDPTADFPDGTLPCSKFPSQYGVLPVDWLNTDGWTGIQINGGAGSQCVEGALCSYACPPGYSKAQWPEEQPASGESHGGLLCKNGKLYKTSKQYNSLCVKGHGNVYVVNKLNQEVPICRTDYPGSENMVVPLRSTPGSTTDLTVPDASTYFTWKGLPTSAQYYVNPAGTSLKDGCVWGKPNGGLGNWSPMIFGAGYHNGMTWLSISQNQLNPSPLNFNVRIVAGPGGKLNGQCKYENGKFSGGGNGEQGCTAALSSGDAYFELY
ncbi:hypothetical protein DFH27DRAFT_533189 [Peziza echinospora]|nr:hypothetical protein DFH27DRAFT_533189 [Peziza echinospora]